MSSADVHVYVLDFGGAGLLALQALPHTAAVVTRDQPDRIERLLSRLTAEVTRRQALLASAGHADLSEQRRAAEPEDRLPHLLLLVHRWKNFVAGYEDVDGGRLLDSLLRLLREGPAVGCGPW